MGLFIRSSMRILQCTKRMLSSNATMTSVKVTKESFDIKNSQIFNDIINSDLIINQKMQTYEIMEESQWAAVRKHLLETYNLNETNVDSKIYDVCRHYKRLDEAVRYFKFLERNNYNIPLVITGNYLNMFYKKNKPITAEEEQEICRIYDDLKTKYPLLDGKTCSDCILALSLTTRWKETVEILDMLKMTSNPGSLVMSAMIKAAFKNNEIPMAWKMMTESIEKFPLQHDVYSEYLNLCKKKFDRNRLLGEVEKIFIFWAQHDIKPNEEIMKEFVDLYKSFGFTIKPTTISENGKCSHCNHQLQATTLSKTDFKILSTSVLKNLIVGKNVFCVTSPQELKRYLIFVQTMKPYDVVIDGLNVAYCNRKPNDPGSLQRVLNVVNYFHNKKKKVLVIGRAHMNWWSKDTMKAIYAKADVFLTKNMTQDDPFLIHVTLLSGSQTYFVTRDLLRQHKFKLKDGNLQIMFRKWQLSRQYSYIVNKGDIELVPPVSFEIAAQKSNDNWHIPYTMEYRLMQPQEYFTPIPRNWFCLTKNKR